MRSILKSGFLWQFIGGFALGAIGVFTLHPSAAETPASPVAAVAPAAH